MVQPNPLAHRRKMPLSDSQLAWLFRWYSADLHRLRDSFRGVTEPLSRPPALAGRGLDHEPVQRDAISQHRIFAAEDQLLVRAVGTTGSDVQSIVGLALP